MIISEVKGNLVSMLYNAINSNVDGFIAAQGCNMQCQQGSGIAGQLRKIPAIFEADKMATEMQLVDSKRPSVARWNDSNQTFFNLYTQPTPGPTAEYEMIDNSLKAMYNILLMDNKEEQLVFLPLIGCGIGGLDWRMVKKIFENSLLNIVVVHYES